MSDDILKNDPFGDAGDLFGDPFGTQSVTPDINTLKTSGTNKLSIVLFIVDCSRSMEGDRIQAVNAALAELKPTLQEIKSDNSLDMKIAIMSFTSSAKWEMELTDIDEVILNRIQTRPGLTEYGNAFHELNKVLRKDQFMKHTGKVAPPAIMFLTDGGPTDNYEEDLNELLKNGWFANASRSAVLLGDAIHDDAAKRAVSKFVEDPDADIVDAENSTVIMHKIKLATMHTVAGDPIDKGNGTDIPDNPPQDIPDTPDVPDTPDFPDFPDFPDTPNFPDVPDTLGGDGNPPVDDPFGTPGGNDPVDDPFGTPGGNDPVDDPFGTPGGNDPMDDPFGTSGGDDGSDPFANASDSDPFGTGDSDGDPFGDQGGNDPFGV